MTSKLSLITRTLYSSLAGLSCLLTIGCRSNYYTHFIEDSPVSIIGQSAMEFISDPEIIDVYKNYFLENKPEFSYRIHTKKTQTKLFFRSKGNFNDHLEYEIVAGIDARF